MKKNLCIVLSLMMMLSMSACKPKTSMVSFDINGGTLVRGELEQEVKIGEDAIAPEVEMEGMEVTWDGDYSKVEEDVKVIAKWTPKSYKVTFDLNGGILINGALEQDVLYGESAAIPEVANGKMRVSWEGDSSDIVADTTIVANWEPVKMTSEDLAEYAQNCTVTVNVNTITGESSTGSGFFIDDKGTLVTNYHVIDKAENITVDVNDGGNYDVDKIIDFNPQYDIAILQIDKRGNEYLDASQEKVRLGASVYAIGSSLGYLDGSFSSGTISSISRTVGGIEYLQTTTPISSGNSGGPLLNGYGQVVGINTASFEEGENLNLAIKIDTLDVLERNKNYTVNDFYEWYIKESSRSYSPFDGWSYYYSLVNTYQIVTGRKCLYSIDEYGNQLTGYSDMCVNYVYEYDVNEYDQYIDYLKKFGFEFQYDEYYTDGYSYYYYNERENVYLDLFVTNTGELWIYPSTW